MEPRGSVAEHLRRYGYDFVLIKVNALSSTANNARQIRDALLAMPEESGPPRLVLIGYSKGAPDILDALVTYPEIHHRIAAVVSAAGAVGGSPLANDAKEYQANVLRYFPGAKCEAGDGTAVASLRPGIRRAWLAANPLPTDMRYYEQAVARHSHELEMDPRRCRSRGTTQSRSAADHTNVACDIAAGRRHADRRTAAADGK